MQNFLAGETNTPIPYPTKYPQWISHGKGAKIYDIEGREFLDLWTGYGALTFGHASDQIQEVIKTQIQRGWLLSNPGYHELRVASLIHDMVPCAEAVRFASTGSEATMYAVRAARSYTNRQKILTIKGAYHGCNDSLMACLGVPEQLSSLVTSVEFNNLEIMKRELKTEEYAAVILEPVPANMGVILPKVGYLQSIRDACDATGTILIFDEVITGFRVSAGGAQTYFNVIPDLATFSKFIGAGLPVSVVAGKKEIMEQFANGNAVFGGTFNANPLSLAVVEFVLNTIKTTELLSHMTATTDRIVARLSKTIEEVELNAMVSGIGPMFTIFFGRDTAENHLACTECDTQQFEYFVNFLADNAVLYPPLPSETVFLSAAHMEEEEHITQKLCDALKAVKVHFK